MLPNGRQVEEVLAEQIMVDYKKYSFNAEMKGESWADFLDSYFVKTMRKTRSQEDTGTLKVDEDFDLFNQSGPLAGNPMAALTGDKPSPIVGVGCTCASIKNYPSREVEVDGGKERRLKAF